MKKILFVGAEAMPFAATGGLGDVMGSLPAALAATGEADVRVMMPLYGQVRDEWRAQMKTEAVFTVHLAWRKLYCGVKSIRKDGVTYYFIDNEYYFRRNSLYGEYDDGERFAFFCMAALEALGQLSFYPDVLHAHDWQAALCPVYLDCVYRSRPGYGDIRTVFTIHNIEYQGKYSFAILGDVFSLGDGEHNRMDWGGCINLMKAAIITADRVSTVSPRYAEEICSPEYAHGLDPILRENAGKLCGILNGIDYVYYDPGKDKELAARFTSRSLQGKTENKLALQREVGLPERTDVPVLSVISRLVAHKGVDIVAGMIERLLCERDVQLVILGKGEDRYEQFFSSLERQYPDRVKALLCYDRDLAKRIYAATDIFLMPSKSEPCGLSQMIASRYGAIPVVRETGGLYDSIKPYYEKGGKMMGNGFTFANYSADELYDRTAAAVDLWLDGERREKYVTKIMRTDFSWKASAQGYMQMYSDL